MMYLIFIAPTFALSLKLKLPLPLRLVQSTPSSPSSPSSPELFVNIVVAWLPLVWWATVIK